MKKKGIFTAAIAFIVLVLAGVNFALMDSGQQSMKAEATAYALLEMQDLTHKINWAADKRISDELADYAFLNGCSFDDGYLTATETGLSQFISLIETPSGIGCSLANFNSVFTGSNPFTVSSDYSIECTASLNGSISFSRGFSSEKEVSYSLNGMTNECSVIVNDLVSGISEVQQAQQLQP